MRQEILNKINESRHLPKINLANMQIGDDDIQEIMDTIEAVNPKITKFNLDNNLLSDIGAQTLSQSLRHFPNVEELSLQFNRINKEGALAIFQLKNDFTDLDIAFHGNKISNVAEMYDIENRARSFR